jgi:2-polyprenyl-3-methyl-5-hydroxy-6-metoxy-1,4-benzoquinol methylase/ribosomal protein S27E
MYVPLRETEIRPDHLAAAQAERFQADVRRLLEHKSEFVAVPCPACGETASVEAWHKYALAYPICASCGTMYMSPRPTPSLLEQYYATSENYHHWNQHIFPASENARRTKIFRPRAERITDIAARHGVRTRTLLEVGAGFGTFCEEVIRMGVFREVIAVEPTPDLAATCIGKGLHVIAQPIEHVELRDEQVDVVASFEVIEHLFCPRDFIASCFRVLAPGGLLVLTCPNGAGFEVVTLRELSSTVDVEHLNYFNPQSLSLLIGSCGFDVLESFTPGKLDAELVRKRALDGGLSLESQPFLRRVLVGEWERLGTSFQQFLAENGLSSHMWVVARKPARG